MSAPGDLFVRRDRIVEILHDVIDDHTTDAKSPAFIDAVRRAAEVLLGSFEISDGRTEGTIRVRGLLQGSDGRDHAAEAREAARRQSWTVPFRETEADRRSVERVVQDTPAKNVLVPMIVGWWKTPGFRPEVVQAALDGTIDVERVIRVTTLPGEVASVLITFRVPDMEPGYSLNVNVNGAEAHRAIEAWEAGQ